MNNFSGPDLDDESNDVDMTDASTSDGKPSTSHKPNWNGKPKTNQQLAAEALIKRIIASVCIIFLF